MRILIVGLLFIVQLAHAGRMLPSDVRRGHLQGANYPMVQIDAEVYRFAPGVQVRNQANMLIFPHALNRQGQVFYQLDARGEVVKIWMMTPEEAAQIASE